MRISGISLYTVALPRKGGRGITRQSTIVKLDTDDGVSGFGEVVPYTPGFAEACRAALVQRGTDLIGQDPFHVDRLNRLMDAQFANNEIKVAIDMALWDVMGRATGRPVSDLLGGHYDRLVPLYEAVFVEAGDTPDEIARRTAGFRRQGYRHLMIKTGRDPVIAIGRIEAACAAMSPGDTVMADAGGSWNLYDAIRVARAFDKDMPVTLIIEQPCATLEECIAFRQHCDLPIKLDELVESTHAVLRARHGEAVEICNIQIARIGGLTKSRRLRDLCIELGVAVVTQDRAGSDIVGAAVAHLAQSTVPEYLLDAYHFPSMVDVVTADGCPPPVDGHFTASSAPGLGISVRGDVLGQPLAVLGESLPLAR